MNNAKLDKKLRRKANRAQRDHLHPLDLQAMQVQAERSTRRRCSLSAMIRSEDAGVRMDARRAKSRLNEHTVRKYGEHETLRGFWNPLEAAK